MFLTKSYLLLLSYDIVYSGYQLHDPELCQFEGAWIAKSVRGLLVASGSEHVLLSIVKELFDGIHPEIFEAARIDGASEPRSFFSIAVPLSIPIFATLAIFIFSTAWNDWFWPSLVMHSEEKYTLATAIYKYVINVKALNTNIKFAILFIVSLPPIIVFLIFQKFIMRGVALSAVKG